MKLLLHACCAPCSFKCVEVLREEGIEPVLFWYNPNIHPYTEYVSRRDALSEFAKQSGAELILRDEYGLRPFLDAVSERDKRCGVCYELRLNEAARYAAENGFDAFSTTLLISPYQDHELLKETAARAAKNSGIEFLYRDFRPFFREGQAAARERGFYMQKYCGCIFSEEERYLKNNR